MQVCTYLDRRFVTSLLSRPNCFSNKKKASTICYAQPVKENKSLVVRSPCPSISSSMSLWRLLLKWQQRKNHRLSISFQPQSNLVLKYILYDTFFCWQNQDLQLWKIIHASIFLCLYFVFRACTRAHVRGLILNNFRTLVMCDCVAWDIWTQMDKNTIKQIKRKKNIFFYWSKMMIFKLCADKNSSDCSHSTRLLAATTLRNVLGTKNLAEILSERETISHVMQNSLDDATDPWGVKVERVEM